MSYGIVSLGAVSLFPLEGSADQIRWDFAGTLSQVSGTGSTRPGAVVGASFAGYAISDTGAFDLASQYSTSQGLTSVFDCSSGRLSYTLTVQEDSYTYNSSLVEVTSVVGPSSDTFGLWGGSFFNVSKRTFQSLGDSSFQGFILGMASGLSDGSASFRIGASSWINSVSGSLSSLTQTVVPIPEPSIVALLGLGAIVASAFRGRMTR